MAKKPDYNKFKNPDKRCTYPFTPDIAGYCWSYAHHIDGTKGWENIENICLKCEYWKENNGKAKV